MNYELYYRSASSAECLNDFSIKRVYENCKNKHLTISIEWFDVLTLF